MITYKLFRLDKKTTTSPINDDVNALNTVQQSHQIMKKLEKISKEYQKLSF